MDRQWVISYAQSARWKVDKIGVRQLKCEWMAYNGKHGPATVDELRLLEPLQILGHFTETQGVEPKISAPRLSKVTLARTTVRNKSDPAK